MLREMEVVERRIWETKGEIMRRDFARGQIVDVDADDWVGVGYTRIQSNPNQTQS